MKREVRFLGIDDSPFVFGEPSTRVVGVVTRGPGYVEGVLSTQVTVDGEDATDAINTMVTGSRFRTMLAAIFLNGVTLGGFNVVDLDRLHAQLGVPVISVLRSQPRAQKAADALRKHFPGDAARLRLLSLSQPVAVRNGRFRVWVSARGVSIDAVEGLLHLATVRGAVPEPIRLAHVIASGIARGESRGQA